MAGSGKQHILGRVIMLLLLIVILVAGGLVWFDYLNLIDVRTLLSPLYGLINREGRNQPPIGEDEYLNLDAERLALRLEALELEELELNQRQQDLDTRRNELEQDAQALMEERKAFDEEQNSFNAAQEEAETKDRNVEQNARYLTGMQPERAVAILVAMDDQGIIDILRKTEEIAQAEGSSSMVAYWLSLLPPDRAAELQRKMAARP